MSDSTPGWQPDPTGKHDHRYWDGTQWTDNVADAGVAGTDAYEPAEVSAVDPTVTEPAVPASDPTATWPTTPGAPAPPPPYVPTSPEKSAGGGGSKRGLLVGGGILAAIAVAVIAVIALSGDDDDDGINGAPLGDTEDTTTTTEDDEGDDGGSSDGSGGGGAYGSDPELDALWDECEGGDYAACDELYKESPFGSEYEDFGNTCGERNEPDGFCVDIYEGGDGTGGLTDSTDDAIDFEDVLADTYEEMFGISREKAECLAGKLTDAVNEGTLDEEEAMTEIFDYLSDCDISMEEIGNN